MCACIHTANATLHLNSNFPLYSITLYSTMRTYPCNPFTAHQQIIGIYVHIITYLRTYVCTCIAINEVRKFTSSDDKKATFIHCCTAGRHSPPLPLLYSRSALHSLPSPCCTAGQHSTPSPHLAVQQVSTPLPPLTLLYSRSALHSLPSPCCTAGQHSPPSPHLAVQQVSTPLPPLTLLYSRSALHSLP